MEKYGGVNKVNIITGKRTSVIVPSYAFLARSAEGLQPTYGYLFVAGAGTHLGLQPQFFVYDLESGEEFSACSPWLLSHERRGNRGSEGLFHRLQYNALIVADAAAAKMGRCDLSPIPLPADQFFDPNFKKLMADGKPSANPWARFGDRDS